MVAIRSLVFLSGCLGFLSGCYSVARWFLACCEFFSLLIQVYIFLSVLNGCYWVVGFVEWLLGCCLGFLSGC